MSGSEKNRRKRIRLESISAAAPNATPAAACEQCRARKVRCDRQQPQCATCLRSGATCTWEGITRRVNHTKELRDDLGVVLERLDAMDQTLSTLSRTTASLVNTVEKGASLSKELEIDSRHAQEHSIVSQVLERTTNETRSPPRGNWQLRRGIAGLDLMQSVAQKLANVVKLEDGVEGEAVARCDGKVRAAARRHLELFPFLPDCKYPNVANDGKPLSTPPRLLVELFLGGFLQHVNVAFPIFSESTLRRHIQEHYDRTEWSTSTEPMALILNNIVVVGLATSCRTNQVGAAGGAADGPLSATAATDELLLVLLQNCDRAIATLESFFELPSIINVQAAISLVLVAGEFYNRAILHKVCFAACQLGQALGLHRSTTPRGVERRGTWTKEDQQLYWVLYALDKQRAFMAGAKCELHDFDADHCLPDATAEHLTPLKRINGATAALMTIWEDMQIRVYSVKALTSAAESRDQHIMAILGRLDEWARQCGDTAMSPAMLVSAADISPLQAELKYAYHLTRTLLLRAKSGIEASSEELKLKHARASLECIRELSTGPGLSPARASSLSRIFWCYPIVAFTDLVDSYLKSVAKGGGLDESQSKADLELLKATQRSLAVLEHPKYPDAYFTRLGLGLKWALDAVQAMRDAAMQDSDGVVGGSPTLVAPVWSTADLDDVLFSSADPANAEPTE